MSGEVPRLIRLVCRVLASERYRAALASEVADEYRRVRATRTRWAAGRWLCREVVALAAARTRGVGLGLVDRVPLILRDVRFVVRGLRRAPVSALAASATLGVGFVAVLVAGSLTDVLVLRNVSAVHQDALRRVVAVDASGRAAYRLAFIEVEEIRRHISGAAEVAVVNLQPAMVRARGLARETMVEVVDGGYSSLVSGATLVGRPLAVADDRAGARPVVVISEGWWRRQFASDPDVLGESIDLNGTAFTVVGVARGSSSASAFGAGVDAWTSIAHADAVLSAGWRTDAEARWFSVFALPRQSLAELDVGLTLAARSLSQRSPETWRGRRLQTDEGRALVGRQRRLAATLVAILGGLAILVLVVGAANVAGVLLARAAASERQTAVHLALGAGRAAIVRRWLLEGAVLGLGGALVAFAGYAWARAALAEVALLPTSTLRLDLPLNSAAVVALAIGAAVVGMLLGVGPATFAARRGVVAGAASGRTVIEGRLSRTRRVLLTLQLAVSFALVVGATLFSRSLVALQAADVGFVRDELVALDFDLEPAMPSAGAAPSARTALAAASTVPGVRAVAMSSRAPVDASTPLVPVRQGRGGPVVVDATVYLATDGYFETVTVRLLDGRAFTADECTTSADVAVVNETLARRLWPDENPLGRALIVGADERALRVVGVAADSKYRSLAESGQPHLYRPTAPRFGLTLLARTDGDPRLVLTAVQRALSRAGGGVVGFFPRTFADHVAIDLLPTRVAAMTAVSLGLVALLLTLVAVYGLVSWFVERRRREIGVRIAIGADPAAVVRLVVGEAMAASLPGLALGAALAAALGLTVRANLHGVGALDPFAYVAGAAALAAVVAVAATAPSWRASRVDPVIALRDI